MDKTNIGILGAFQNGKSTFVNCLLDDLVARTGCYGKSVTSINTKYKYGDIQNVEYFSYSKLLSNPSLHNFISAKSLNKEIDRIEVSLWKPILNEINLIDTPGFNANEKDTKMAISSLKDLDIAILIINNKGLSTTELEIMDYLNTFHIPFFVIMNCLNRSGDSWNPNSKFNIRIKNEVLATIRSKGIVPEAINGEQIWLANFLWFWYSSEQYINDEEEMQKEYLEDLNFYYKSKSKRVQIKPHKEFFLENSNFLPLRNFFSSDSLRNGFPLTLIRWRTAVDKIIVNWEESLKIRTKK